MDEVYKELKAIPVPIKDMMEIILEKLKYLEDRVTELELKTSCLR